MNARFAVKNAKTGKFFAGFDYYDNAIWAEINKAKPFATKIEAQAQANLFKAIGVNAQLKPQVL